MATYSYGAFDSGLPTAGGFGNVGYGKGPGRGQAAVAYAAPGGAGGGDLAARAEADRARMLELARSWRLPYTPEVIAGQVSQAADQAEAARKAEIERAGAGFAAAGLGAGGGLMSAQDAATRASQAQVQAARTDIQGRAAIANFQAQQQAIQDELGIMRDTQYQEEGAAPDLGFGGGGIGGGGGGDVRIFGRKTPGSYGMPQGARLKSPQYAAGPGQTTPKTSWQQFEDRKRAQAEARRQNIASGRAKRPAKYGAPPVKPRKTPSFGGGAGRPTGSFGPSAY